jgi:multiple antibiotic resistance protein
MAVTEWISLFAAYAIQLFLIVDPLVAIPSFLAITPHNRPEERREMARRGCIIAYLVIVVFILTGPALIGYLGIRTPAIRICGGILLFLISVEMLYGRSTGTGTSEREERIAGTKDDISVTPLAIPLLAGPGAIATTLLFADRARGAASVVVLLSACTVVFLATHLLLRRAGELQRWVGPLGITILVRIMGLVLAFISIQYVVDGVSASLGR